MDRIAQELQSENMILEKRILNLELARENKKLRIKIAVKPEPDPTPTPQPEKRVQAVADAADDARAPRALEEARRTAEAQLVRLAALFAALLALLFFALLREKELRLAAEEALRAAKAEIAAPAG